MNDPAYGSSRAAVRALLLTGVWYTGPTLQKGVKYLTGKMYDTTGLTARIRECRPELNIVSRPKRGCTSYEYRNHPN